MFWVWNEKVNKRTLNYESWNPLDCWQKAAELNRGVNSPQIDSPLDFYDFYLYHCPKCDIELYHCSLYYFSLRRLPHQLCGILVTPYFTLSSWNKLVSYKVFMFVYLPISCKYLLNLWLNLEKKLDCCAVNQLNSGTERYYALHYLCKISRLNAFFCCQLPHLTSGIFSDIWRVNWLVGLLGKERIHSYEAVVLYSF